MKMQLLYLHVKSLTFQKNQYIGQSQDGSIQQLKEAKTTKKKANRRMPANSSQDQNSEKGSYTPPRKQ